MLRGMQRPSPGTGVPPPPIDAELAETVWPLVSAGRTVGLTAADIPAYRDEAVSRYRKTDEALRRGGTVEFEERLIPGPPGAPDLPTLILSPANRDGAVLPAVILIANGGKILRDTRLFGDWLLDWVAEEQVVVVSVAPRVGPEDPHPAQVDDAFAGMCWTAAHTQELGVDPARLLLLGISGGGGIAAGAALMARDRGGPRVSRQILVYPMLDDRAITPSSRFEGINWDRLANRTGWEAILGGAAAGSDVSPYAAPARALDLTGLPPTYLEVGSSEVFRDEVIDFAARLAQAGVPIDLHVWSGGFHAFDVSNPTAELSRAAVAARTSYLRRAVRRSGSSG